MGGLLRSLLGFPCFLGERVVMRNLPAVPHKPLPKDIIKEIAMDIGKEVAHYIEHMYPKAVEAASSTFLLSVRNSIYNEIMASIEVNDEGKIIARLQKNKKLRAHQNKMLKVQKNASTRSPDYTMKQLAVLDIEFRKIMQ
jgi:hypothetical protein